MRSLVLIATLLASSTSAQDEAPALQAQLFAQDGAEESLVAEANIRVGSYMDGLRACLPEGGGPWQLQLFLDAQGEVSSIEFSITGADRPCIERIFLHKLVSRGVGPRVRLEVTSGASAPTHPLGRGGGSGEGTLLLGNLGDGNRGTSYGNGASMMSDTLGRVRAGRLSVQGSMQHRVVRRVVRRFLDRLRYCYERELHRVPDVQGTIVLRFAISTDGRVVNVRTERIDGGLVTVAACAARLARRWRFPAHQDAGLVIVTYPFSFSP